MAGSKPRRITNVLLWMDYECPTGFANVARNLVKHVFADGLRHRNGKVHFNIVCVAVNYFGVDFRNDFGVMVHSAKLHSVQQDDFGRDYVMRLLKDENFDLFFVLNDLQVIKDTNGLLKYVKKLRTDARKDSFYSMFYFPVDCEPLKEWTVDLDAYDQLITYTNWGALEMRKMGFKKVKVIPHGHDFNDFYAIDAWAAGKEAEEAAYFRVSYFHNNKQPVEFVITSIARNTYRKDVPATLFAFREFVHKHHLKPKDVMLYLHMNPHDPRGFNLKLLAEELGIEKYVKFPPDFSETKGIDLKTLNLIYNTSDLFLSTTLGEGWGLPITESMATRLPMVAPVHTSIAEITEQGKLMLKAIYQEDMVPHVHALDHNRFRWTTDPYIVAEHVSSAYTLIMAERQESRRSNIVEQTLDDAEKKVYLYDWERVAIMWKQLIQESKIRIREVQ